MKKMWILFPITAICIFSMLYFNYTSVKTVALNGEYVKCDDLIESVEAAGIISCNSTEDFYTSQNLILTLAVAERDISKVNIGNLCDITCVAVPNTVYTGTVTNIAAYAKQITTGIKDSLTVVEVTIEFTGDTSGLKAGYSAQATIIGNKAEDAITVPFEAVISKNGESFVWVFKDEKAVLQKVETGIETDFDTQIVSGLNKNDIIIVNPPWKENTSNIDVKSEEVKS